MVLSSFAYVETDREIVQYEPVPEKAAEACAISTRGSSFSAVFIEETLASPGEHAFTQVGSPAAPFIACHAALMYER